jgi:hypothetical protein
LPSATDTSSVAGEGTEPPLAGPLRTGTLGATGTTGAVTVTTSVSLAANWPSLAVSIST